MQKAYDIVAKVGSYEKDGETKNRYKNVGAVMKTEDGMFLFMDKTFNPAGVPSKEGSESIILNLFEPKPREEKKPQSNIDF